MIDLFEIFYFINDNFLLLFFLFIGIVGVFLLLFPDKDNTRKSKRIGSTATTYRDGKIININYLCPHCKNQLKLSVVDDINEKGVVRCPFCGKSIYKSNL